MTAGTYALSGAVALAVYLAYAQIKERGRPKLPPGPKPLPVLGNIKDFPPDGVPEHLHWLQHKDLYGGISSVTVMGMTLVIIHDKYMAHDLLEVQAAGKTSGRPDMVMANKLCGYESIAVCQSYTPTFRRYRKFLHQELGTKKSAAQFRDVQDIEVKRQLVRALREPQKLLNHYKTNAAASVLQMAYGYNIEQHDPDVLVDMADQMMREFSLAASPMAWAVDIIPALQHIPENFPGATFKKTARKWRKSIQACAHLPYEFVQKQMTNQTNRPSYVSKLVQLLKDDKQGLSAEDEEAIVWSAASLYGAAADTTVITLTTFTLAMLKFPEVQKKAQEELDRVIGEGALPNLDDRDRLPYINAVVKEATRWWVVSPMGFPHTATEEFLYEGHRIPKGAIIMPAVYWFLHDPSVYANPDVFDPDRFLSPRNEPDPTTEAFGFGRRICPGRFFADQGLFLNIAMTLACFNIKRPIGEDGKEVEVDVQPKPGVLTYPTEFGFNVVPRSDKHKQLIEGLARKHPFETSDAEFIGSLEDFEVRY